MSKKITTNLFKELASKVHNSYYDYGKSIYTGSKSNITITCKTHGDFEQKSGSHLEGRGCKKCGYEKLKGVPPSTKEVFIKKAIVVHENIYEYNKVVYSNSQNKVTITCKSHGDFYQKPNNHIMGQGCPKCADIKVSGKITKELSTFKKEAIEVHKNKYNYEKVAYKNNKSIVTIICPIHGEFSQRASAHISGQGCITCGQASNYKKENYIKKAGDRKCILYTLRCFNEQEEFYKVGITMNTIRDRYNTNKKMPYNYEIVREVYGDAGYIWDLELSEKRRLKDSKHQPIIKFAGSKTECFTKI